MRRSLLAATALIAALSPSADAACTIETCAEVAEADARTPLGMPPVAGTCTVAGRGYTRFAVTANAVAGFPALSTTVRCRAWSNGVLVYDRTETLPGSAVAFADTYVAPSRVTVCVTVTSGGQTAHGCG